MNGLFVRVTRANGSTLYESGLPKDASFDPDRVSSGAAALTQVSSRTEHLSGDADQLVCAVPFDSRDGSRFLIETGKPLKQSDSVLHGLLLTFAVGLPLVVAVAVAPEGGVVGGRRGWRWRTRRTVGVERRVRGCGRRHVQPGILQDQEGAAPKERWERACMVRIGIA